MVVLGRPGRHHVGAPLQDLVRVLAVDEVEQLRVAIEVVEVLQQPEVEGLLDVRVRLGAREIGGELDGDLLVADGGLEHGLVRGVEPVHGVLLLVLDPAQGRQRRLEVGVVGHARERVREDARLVLDAVHEDDPAPRERVDVLFAIGRECDVLPRSDLPLDRDAALFERIHRHGLLRGKDHPTGGNSRAADRSRSSPTRWDGRGGAATRVAPGDRRARLAGSLDHATDCMLWSRIAPYRARWVGSPPSWARCQVGVSTSSTSRR